MHRHYSINSFRPRSLCHNDVKVKNRFLHYWALCGKNHQVPVMWNFDMSIDIKLNVCWTNSQIAGTLRCHDTHVMSLWYNCKIWLFLCMIHDKMVSHNTTSKYIYRQFSNIRRTQSQNMLLVSSCSCLCPIHWSQVLSWEWRCSWSSADRRCSNYIWVINNFIAY